MVYGLKTGNPRCKPINVHIVLRKVSFFLKLYQQRQKSHEAREEMAKQKEILEKLASHDDLTGLLNRRSLNITLGQEFARCQRYHSDLSLLMMDLDYFKKINQTDIKGAIKFAERFRQQDAREVFVSPTQKAQVTVSIGVSSFGKSQPKVQNDLIAFADKALYLAKENGRNRTEILTFTVAQ